MHPKERTVFTYHEVKKLSKLLKIQAVVFAVIIAVGVCSVGAFAYNCSRVRSDVLRMHVIANSDSDEDQALKLKFAMPCSNAARSFSTAP